MAIDDLLDEHEQSERVRSWLRNNGAGLLGGVALGLAVILGWQWWQKDQAGKKEQAYQEYQTAVEGLAKGDLKQAKAANLTCRGGARRCPTSRTGPTRMPSSSVPRIPSE